MLSRTVKGGGGGGGGGKNRAKYKSLKKESCSKY
jgi:hypothetical protein